MEDFKDIEIPSKSGSYMKFNQPENLFRILGKPITGYVGWKTQADGSRKPLRRRTDEKIIMGEVDSEDEVKYFWAMPVFNYHTEQVEILELTQKSIQKAIKDLARDKDFGSPTEYDIKVTKTGEGKETRYSTMGKPPKKLDEAIAQLYLDTPINLEALFDNKNPFEVESEFKTNGRSKPTVSQ